MQIIVSINSWIHVIIASIARAVKKQTQVIKWLVFGFCVVFTIFEV